MARERFASTSVLLLEPLLFTIVAIGDIMGEK
jgi:hypothetical protein